MTFQLPRLPVFVLSFLGVSLASQSDSKASVPRPDHAPFDAILAATVRDERIDYVAVRDDYGAALLAYRQTMANVDAKRLPEPEALAYWFNVYNASMIAAVVDRLRGDWTPATDDFAVFKAKTVLVSGGVTTLDAVEHDILRKEFEEPRLHVALVCGARSCPPLLPRAYRGEDLDPTLAANLTRFVRDPARNRVDVEGKTLVLSRIFDWFKDDFGGETGVRALVGRQVGVDAGRFALSYLDYDWHLNWAPPRDGWLVAAVGKVPLASAPATDDVLVEVEAGTVLHAVGESDGMLTVVVPGKGADRGYLPVARARRL
ncbi:MAG: DUF547 domain-containing protein [Planctomycetota bacterium]